MGWGLLFVRSTRYIMIILIEHFNWLHIVSFISSQLKRFPMMFFQFISRSFPISFEYPSSPPKRQDRCKAHSLISSLANLLSLFSSRNLLIVSMPGASSLRKRPAHILISSSGIVFVYSGAPASVRRDNCLTAFMYILI